MGGDRQRRPGRRSRTATMADQQRLGRCTLPATEPTGSNGQIRCSPESAATRSCSYPAHHRRLGAKLKGLEPVKHAQAGD